MKRTITCFAAVMAMCAVGAMATAAVSSATVLCSKNVTACPSESIYPSGTTVEGKLKSGTKVEFTTKMLGLPVSITCTGSTISGKTTGENALPLPGTITGLSLSGCGGNCATAEPQHLPYTSAIEKTTPGNGTASMSSSGAGDPIFDFTECPGAAHCIWGSQNLAFQISGGNPAVLSANGDILTKQAGSGGLCKEPLTVASLSYEVTKPAPMYVAGGPHAAESVLCKEDASVCTPGSAYKAGTTIAAETLTGERPWLSLGTYGLVECNTGEMAVETEQEHGDPLGAHVNLAFPGTCAGKCQTITPAKNWEGKLNATSAGDGTLTVGGQWTLSCGVDKCIYVAENKKLTVTGGTSAVLETNGVWEMTKAAGSNGWCPAVSKFSAKYYSSSPNPVYLSKVEG